MEEDIEWQKFFMFQTDHNGIKLMKESERWNEKLFDDFWLLKWAKRERGKVSE